MPGRDRTGPSGMGPATGWGLGGCAGPGQASGTGRGSGRPFCGQAAGRGWRHWYHATGLPGWARWPAGAEATASEPSREQEIEALREETGQLKEQLEAISARMDELSRE